MSKVVVVEYIHKDVIRIPKDIDLNNKEQVKDWEVINKVLIINMTDGTKERIESENWVASYFSPDKTYIEDKDDWIDYDDYDEDEEDNSDDEEEVIKEEDNNTKIWVIKTYEYNHTTKTIDYAGLWEDEDGNKEFKIEEEASKQFDYATEGDKGYVAVELVEIDLTKNEDRETIVDEWENNISEYDEFSNNEK